MTALRAIAIGNIVVHVVSLGVDFSEGYERNAGVWFGVIVHVLIAAFAYALMNWQKVAKAA